MVAFRYCAVNHNILALVHHCLFSCIGHLYNLKKKRHAPCPILEMRINQASTICIRASWGVLATAPSNLPAVQGWTAQSGQFGSRPVQQPDQLLLGRSITDRYPSTHGFWQGLVIPVSANLRFCFSGYSIYGPIQIVYSSLHKYQGWYVIAFFGCIGFLYDQKKWETDGLPHLGNQRQQSVNDLWSCILGNLSGDWLQTVINGELAAFISKIESDVQLPLPEYQHQQSVNNFSSHILHNLSGSWSLTSIKEEYSDSLGR